MSLLLGRSGVIAAAGAAGATQIAANGVTWSWAGARQAGVLPWGQAYVVVPSGDESLAEPAPAAGLIEGVAGSRAEINPAFPPAQAQGYDSRMGFYSAGRATTSWPATVTAQDIVIKCVSAASTGEVRDGLADRYGALVVLPAPPPADTLGYVAVSWAGRTTLQPVVVDLDTALAAYPSYALAGLGLAAPADVIAEIDRYWPTMGQIWGAGSTSGYQLAAPQNIFGTGAYGTASMPSVSRALMHLIGDAASAAQKRTMLSRLIQFGADAYEARFRTPGNAAPGNGAHYQIEFVCACLFLHHTGRGDEIADIATTMGFNHAQQIFELTPAMIDALATPHDSATGPCLSRRREVLSVSGLDITLEAFAEDPFRINFAGLEVVRESDGAAAASASLASDAPDRTAPYPVPLDAQPTSAFQVGDIVTLRRAAPLAAGEADYRSNLSGDDVEGFGGLQFYLGSADSDAYRVLCHTGIATLFLRAIGAFPQSFAALETYFDLCEDAAHPAGGPWRRFGGRPHIFANAVEQSFSTAHKAAIRAVSAGHAGRPAFFAADDWAAAPAGAGEIAVTIDALPDARGAALTAVEASTDGGQTWATLTASPAVDIFTISGLTPGASVSLAIRAVNAVGAGPRSSVETVSAGGVVFATEPTVAAFATGPGGAAPVFSGRREQNSGLVFVSGAGEPGEVVQGRMVRASDGVAVSAWMDIATADASDGSFEGWIEGAPRSFDALRAQVRYRDAGNAPAATSNTCFIGWVMSLFAQSDQRWLGDTNFEGVSLTPTVALHDNRCRVITLQRDEITPAPVTAANLLVFDVAGSPATGRDPVWRWANTAMELLTDGPIVLMGHAVSGTNDRQTVNDSDNARFWEDEVLIAQAGQPHLVETDRPVALDLVYWAYSSSANYATSAQALGIIGRIAFGVDPSGAPVAPGTSITEFGGSFNYVQDHSWAEIYDWTHTKLGFRPHPNPAATLALETFAGHAVYGGFVAGFPTRLSPHWLTNGTRQPDGSWNDGGHASNNQVGGFSEIAALAAAGMAYAAGAFDPGDIVFDYIDWPTAPGDDPKYVHVGIAGRDITSMRELNAAESPPVVIGGAAVLGGATGFTVNGTRTIDTALVTHEGFRRIRIGKQDGSNWTNADVLAWDPPSINYVGLSADQDADRDTLSRFLDHPIVESGLASKPGLPVADFPSPGLFTNPLPAAGVSYTVLEHATFGAITAGAPANVTTIIGHDGSPLIIWVATSSTSGADAGYPNAATLGGVSIHPQTIRWASSAFKLNLYHVASPGTGDLALDVGFGADANGGTVHILRVDAGQLGAPPTVAASGGTPITTMAPGVASPQGGSTALHMIMASGPTTGVTLGGAGAWDAAAVELSGSHWTRLGVVEDVGSGSASGFSASFSPAQRVLHATTYIRPPAA